MRQDVGETRDVSRLELWTCAKTHGDLETWVAFQRSLEETLLTWFHEHPAREAPCRLQSERHFVALAFERLWQAVVQRPDGMRDALRDVGVPACESERGYPGDTGVSACPGAVSSPWPDVEERSSRSAVRDRLQALLSNERERRLAYLLYHCGLKPAEIVRGSRQAWSDVHEVARLQRTIVVRLMKGLTCEGHTFVSQDVRRCSCVPIVSVLTEVEPKHMRGVGSGGT